MEPRARGRSASARQAPAGNPLLHDDRRHPAGVCDSGHGPPLVKASNWLTHLDFEWESPIWRHWWEALSQHHRVVRYDERGNGMSQRDVADVSFDTWVKDLETVVDAAGLDRFALLGDLPGRVDCHRVRGAASRARQPARALRRLRHRAEHHGTTPNSSRAAP